MVLVHPCGRGRPVAQQRIGAFAHLALGDLWNTTGATALRTAPVRQAPIAVALVVAASQAQDGEGQRGALLAAIAIGVASGVLPLLWRRRA